MTLSDLHARALRYMFGVFNDHGKLPVTFFCVDRQKAMHILVAPEYPAKRVFFEMLMKAYFIHYGVATYGTASEAWIASEPIEATTTDETGHVTMKPGFIAPSKRPDRREVIITSAVTKDELMFRTYEIIRREGKPPRAGKELVNESQMTVERTGMMGLMEGIDTANPSPEGSQIFEKVLLPELERREYFALRKIIPLAEYDRERN